MSESYTNVYWIMEQGSEALQGGQAYWYFIVTFCNIQWLYWTNLGWFYDYGENRFTFFMR